MARLGLTLLGAALILAVLRDVLHELFHPEASGSISAFVMRTVWRGTRILGKRRGTAAYHAGPMILVAVALCWTTLLALGWTLLYWPRLGDSFTPNPRLGEAATHGFATAVYVSLASMSTLSASDITPTSVAMRYAVTLESFVGPIIFTAWITWVLSIYPVLAERRAFARQIEILRRTDANPAAAPAASVPVTAELLLSFTEQVLRITAHVQQSRVTYYFQNDTPGETLARQLPWAMDVARAAAVQTDNPALARHGAMLSMAIEDLLQDLAANYLGKSGASPHAVIGALVADNMLQERRKRPRET